ncbi:MAG: ABC transporter ATP-binding protein [Solirubrobacteraceae bacterium]
MTDAGATAAPAAADSAVPTSSTSILAVQDVRVRYGGVEAVAGVSMTIETPQIVGLIGPNGAGKSSLLAAVGGQVRTTAGRVLLRERDVTRLPPYRRARIGLVRTFQTAGVFDRLTVAENLLVAGMGNRGSRLWGAVAGRTARVEAQAQERVLQVLTDLELRSMTDAYGAELSGGQRRLVEMARCMMCSPTVLLLDEPMVGVAPHLVARIGETCRRIRDTGVAIVIVEHAMEVVESVCDRVVVMAVGEILDDGTYASVMSNGSVRDAYLA